LYALTLPNINRFSKLFHCQNWEKICKTVDSFVSLSQNAPAMIRTGLHVFQ